MVQFQTAWSAVFALVERILVQQSDPSRRLLHHLTPPGHVMHLDEIGQSLDVGILVRKPRLAGREPVQIPRNAGGHLVEAAILPQIAVKAQMGPSRNTELKQTEPYIFGD